MLVKFLILAVFCACVLWLATESNAAPAATNYDESKVPRYTLPDPLELSDGQRVTDARTWLR